MKKGIHPEYYESTVRCACGAEVTTRTTMKDLHVDTAGRIEKFNRKYGKAKPAAEQAEPANPQ